MTTVETRRQILFNRRESGVAMLLLDCGGKLNYLGSALMGELDDVLKAVRDDESIKAVVIMSAKPDNFVIGADLYEIRKATSYDEVLALSLNGHKTLDMVAGIGKPVVMAINGPCLGGGLELALTGNWRIATNDKATQFAFPETRLGLIPGLGGTQRTPRLIGIKSTLSMILSAEPIGTDEALSIGLVDEVVAPGDLMATAEKRALALAADPSPIKQREAAFTDLDEAKMGKLFAMTERSIRIKTRGNYPAQTKAIEVIKTGLEKGIAAGRELESTVFAELAIGEVSSNLISLFFATDFARQSAINLANKFDAADTKTIGVVGGGMMGQSIAYLAATHGMRVKFIVSAGKEEEVYERVQRHELIEVSSDSRELADAQFVLEAVFEDVAAKRAVMMAAESESSPECTLSSNTSSLPLEEIGADLKNHDRFVGVHFFHPVDRMPLVEIVAMKDTSRKAVARAADFVTRLGKIPVMVKNGPGFLINRMLTSYMMEASKAADESVPLNWVEEAAISFGMPIGPFELLDEVGEDVAWNVVESLQASLGERYNPPRLMHDFRIYAGKGKRFGSGVYIWDEGGKRKGFSSDIEKMPYLMVSETKCPEDQKKALIERIIFPMIDEAARCLEEKIVTKPREIDMAIINGIGFPPFRGGLLKYADQCGLERVAARLREVYTGSPRTVSALIEKYVAEGRNFYSSKAGGKEDE